MHGVDLNRDLPAAVDHVMDGFSHLAVHPDVPDGVRALRHSGRRLVTLSNGSAQVAERLLAAAGIRDQFETLLSVEDAGVWKPAGAAYEYAARSCGTELPDMLLVAVHPWDIDGAARAGMTTAWINRGDTPYADCCTPPSRTASGLTDLARPLARPEPGLRDGRPAADELARGLAPGGRVGLTDVTIRAAGLPPDSRASPGGFRRRRGASGGHRRRWPTKCANREVSGGYAGFRRTYA